MGALTGPRWLPLAIACGVAALGLWGLGVNAARAQVDRPLVYIAELSGVINPLSSEYLARVLADADRDRAAAVVLRLDTPGGLDSSMRSMAQAILASRAPVIVYVAPAGARAASAGLFVAMSAHVAAMAPGTNIGAAHPVALGGSGESEGTNVAADKAVADAAAYIRSLATLRGRNVEWAERAVRESISASATEAVELNVVDLIAADLTELLRAVDGRQVSTEAGPFRLRTAGAQTVSAPMNLAERFLHVITDPNIALALLALGTIGIVAEFYHPGALFPGIGGAIALVLAWVALGSLPTNWGGVALLALAFALLIAELYTQTFGVLATGALAAFILGALLLFRPVGAPSVAAPDVGVSPLTIVMTTGALAMFTWVVLRALFRQRNRRPLSGPEALIGAVGAVVADLQPQGIVRLGGEDWSAVTHGPPLRAGQAARVIGVRGVTLEVERAADADLAPSAHAEPRPRRRRSQP